MILQAAACSGIAALGHLRGSVEGLAAHEWGRHAGDAQRQQDPAVQGALANGMIVVIGAVDGVVGAHGHAVGTLAVGGLEPREISGAQMHHLQLILMN